MLVKKTIGHSGYWAWVTPPGDNESGRLTVCQNWIDRMLHDPHMITSTCLIHWICLKIIVYLWWFRVIFSNLFVLYQHWISLCISANHVGNLNQDSFALKSINKVSFAISIQYVISLDVLFLQTFLRFAT